MVLTIVIISISVLYSIKSPDFSTQNNKYGLLITRISGNKVVLNSQNKKSTREIHDFHLPPSGELQTDLKTAFEFGYAGILFVVYPESLLSYQLSTRELNFKKGILEWNREKDTEKIQIHTGSLQYVLTLLSDAGKIEISDKEIKIWNYRGNLEYHVNKTKYKLNPNKLIRLEKKDEKITQHDILPATRKIFPGYPRPKVINLIKASDYSVVLNWLRNVSSAGRKSNMSHFMDLKT